MIVQVNLVYVGIAAAACGFAFVLSICVFLIARSCRTPKDIRGKVALVTGGASGLGKQICIQLASQGCKVAVADIDLSAAQKTSELLVEMCVASRAYQVDFTSNDEILLLKKKILRDLGEVDILINNVGSFAYKSIFAQSAEEIEQQMKISFSSVVLTTKCFLENMMRRKTGHIATVTSFQGIYPLPHSITYCSAKFGLTGFMLSLKELIRQGGLRKRIYTTCIMHYACQEESVKAGNPLHKTVKIDQVAKAAVDGLMLNDTIVASPCLGMYYLIRIFNILPFFAQHFIRDYLRAEKKVFGSHNPNVNV